MIHRGDTTPDFLTKHCHAAYPPTTPQDIKRKLTLVDAIHTLVNMTYDDNSPDGEKLASGALWCFLCMIAAPLIHPRREENRNLRIPGIFSQLKNAFILKEPNHSINLTSLRFTTLARYIHLMASLQGR